MNSTGLKRLLEGITTRVKSIFSNSPTSSLAPCPKSQPIAQPKLATDKPVAVPSTSSKPAHGIEPWKRKPPVVTNNPDQRNSQNYSRVIEQFDVKTDSRYQAKDGKTYCNIFAWDVTLAMGAEIPHWIDPKTGSSSAPGKGTELSANSTVNWLNQHGSEYGWKKVTPTEAQTAANEGHPTVGVWKNPSGASGHIVIVRPGEIGKSGPVTAQAGLENFENGTAAKSFGNAKGVEYWTHN